MAMDSQPEAWMRPALAWLFDSGDESIMRRAIQDPASLAQLRAQLDQVLTTPAGSLVPEGSRGDNLILALIALRLKFPRPDAEAKLEKNLSLRRPPSSQR